MQRQLAVIAHRGASSRAPENTVAAITAAANLGADMVELDLRMSRDGQVVIFHDADLSRTTNGSGAAESRDWAELAGLDAGSWFDPRFSGERIPLLREALEALPAWLAVNLELKTTNRREELVERLLTALAAADRLDSAAGRPLVSAEDPLLIRLCAAQGLPVALITDGSPASAVKEAARLGCAAWHPGHTQLSPQIIEAAHATGLNVNTWTIDDPDRMAELSAWKVDGIFTNKPDVLLELTSREGHAEPQP